MGSEQICWWTELVSMGYDVQVTVDMRRPVELLKSVQSEISASCKSMDGSLYGVGQETRRFSQLDSGFCWSKKVCLKDCSTAKCVFAFVWSLHFDFQLFVSCPWTDGAHWFFSLIPALALNCIERNMLWETNFYSVTGTEFWNIMWPLLPWQ